MFDYKSWTFRELDGFIVFGVNKRKNLNVK